MQNIKKVINNKWLIILVLILACYGFAAVYETADMTPVDEFVGMMSSVAESEEFAQQYQGEMLGMDLNGYKDALDGMSVLKSRFLQGPFNFLICLMSFVVSLALVHISVRLEEALRKTEYRTRLSRNIDVCIPSLLALAAKYALFAVYANVTGELAEYKLVLSTVCAVAVSCVPFILAIVDRKRNGNCVTGLSITMILTAAANVAFQLT